MSYLKSYQNYIKLIMENNTTAVNYNIFEDSVGVIAIAISSIGIIANSVLLFLFIADPVFRKTVYYLMLISCLTDLIANAANIASYVTYFKKTLYIALLCKILGFLIYVSYGVSIMNLSLIAIYRYFSVVRPFAKVYTTYKMQFVIISEVVIWMICIIVCLPDLVFLNCSSILEGYATMIRSHHFCRDILSPLLLFITLYLLLSSSYSTTELLFINEIMLDRDSHQYLGN